MLNLIEARDAAGRLEFLEELRLTHVSLLKMMKRDLKIDHRLDGILMIITLLQMLFWQVGTNGLLRSSFLFGSIVKAGVLSYRKMTKRAERMHAITLALSVVESTLRIQSRADPGPVTREEWDGLITAIIAVERFADVKYLRRTRRRERRLSRPGPMSPTISDSSVETF
jgi:hypothetical protein